MYRIALAVMLLSAISHGFESSLAQPEQQVEEEPSACWGEVFTFARDEKGTDCETSAAEIVGHSSQCVTKCDDAARLAEAVASARVDCAKFCELKGCPGPRYSPPEKCGKSDCREGDKHCNQKWSTLNTCWLRQAEQVWNCVCVGE